MSSQIIAQTNFSKGKDGLEVPFRLILKTEGNKHVSRFQNFNGMEHSGNYYHGTLEEAKEAFVKRIKNHNDLFPTGNVSHLGNDIQWFDAISQEEKESCPV